MDVDSSLSSSLAVGAARECDEEALRRLRGPRDARVAFLDDRAEYDDLMTSEEYEAYLESL